MPLDFWSLSFTERTGLLRCAFFIYKTISMLPQMQVVPLCVTEAHQSE